MFVLFSGEGPTDCGLCNGDAPVCQGEDFLPGPMAVVADQIIENSYKYSILESGSCGCVAKQRLIERAGEMKAVKKGPLLPGKKRAKETAYFFQNARALALCARELATALDHEVIAILFRDADGTASAGRGLWAAKHKSMIDGFEVESFSQGVPMIPQPKSEAWMICGLKANPYQDCESLEERSGNDNSPNSLKGELAELCGHSPNREELCDIICSRKVDFAKIVMPSFIAFRDRLVNLL